jgi:succinoglycan biosynthesis transport protein ExoP
MGYVFDAMNRPDDQDKPKQQGPKINGLNNLPPANLKGHESVPENFKFTEPQQPTPEDSHDSEGIDDRLIAIVAPSTSTAEEYRAIRTGLLAKWEHRRHLIHTITSATPQEGKTITSLNLGLTFAELRNRRTIVIEGDLRLPQFKKLMNLDDCAGLVGVLADGAELSESIQRVGENLDVLPAGRAISRDAVQLLSSQKMADLLKALRREYDHVIVDTPPVVELADAGILGALSDEVLLIARMNRTPKSLVDQAIRTLKGYNAPVSGLIATDQSQSRQRYYYYRYGYRYQYRYYAKAA